MITFGLPVLTQLRASYGYLSNVRIQAQVRDNTASLILLVTLFSRVALSHLVIFSNIFLFSISSRAFLLVTPQNIIFTHQPCLTRPIHHHSFEHNNTPAFMRAKVDAGCLVNIYLALLGKDEAGGASLVCLYLAMGIILLAL